MTTNHERVLIPEDPSSVHYHARHCGTVNRDRAGEVAREDAEALGYRPHVCVTGGWNRPDRDGGDRREVPA